MLDNENEILNTEEPSAAPAGTGPRPVETSPALDTAPWFARIEAAGLEELPALEREIKLLPTDEENLKPLQAALVQRRRTLWAGELAAMTEGCETMDCAGLLELARRVGETEYPEDLRKSTLDTLHTQYTKQERAELDALTREQDTLDIPALRTLAEKIQAGPYTDETRTPYLDRLNDRIDALHIRALTEICTDVEQAERETLTAVRSAVDARDCAETLKAEFYRRIEARKDELDDRELAELTADLDSKTPKELADLLETLQTGEFNPKFRSKYLLQTTLAREAAFFRQIPVELADLDYMDRGQVVALQNALTARNQPRRITVQGEKRIAERLYRLDLQNLTDRDNCFDELGFEQLDIIRGAMARMELSDRARSEYEARLDQREQNLVLENTSTQAGLVDQASAQNKIRRSRLVLPTSPNYAARLEKFWGGTGLEQPRDIPVFLLENLSTLGFSGQRFWYKSGKDLAFLAIADIDHFQCMKQFLTVKLQVVRKDSTYLLTEARLRRIGSDKVIDYLNECLRRWQDPALAESFPPKLIHTPGFDPAAINGVTVDLPLNEHVALELLRADYAARKRKDGNLFTGNPEEWTAKVMKLTLGFELPQQPELVWYCSNGLLGSLKEGVAVGPKGLWARIGKQPALAVPVERIWNLEKTGAKRVLLTETDGSTRELELPGDMAPLLLDYVRCIQLAAYLNRGEADHEA